ncbi:MAG: hypothetical protein ACYTXP_16685 [Nostoc sp.]
MCNTSGATAVATTWSNCRKHCVSARVTVLASKAALQFLEGFVCDRFSKRVVKTGDRSLVNFRVLITNKAGKQQR